jgi:L-fuculokinase
LLARAFPELEIFGAAIAQSTSMGAALAIHKHWNSLPVPKDIIEVKYFGPREVKSLSIYSKLMIK